MPEYVENVVVPVAVSVTPGGSTIVAGGTYEVALSANVNRKGGGVQNNGTADMFLFLGDGTASKAKSLVLVKNGGTLDLNLGTPGCVYQGEVQIDGTTADAFATIEFT